MNSLIKVKKFQIKKKLFWINILNKFEEDNFIFDLKKSINSVK